jgi:hypothetical protein
MTAPRRAPLLKKKSGSCLTDNSHYYELSQSAAERCEQIVKNQPTRGIQKNCVSTRCRRRGEITLSHQDQPLVVVHFSAVWVRYTRARRLCKSLFAAINFSWRYAGNQIRLHGNVTTFSAAPKSKKAYFYMYTTWKAECDVNAHHKTLTCLSRRKEEKHELQIYNTHTARVHVRKCYALGLCESYYTLNELEAVIENESFLLWNDYLSLMHTWILGLKETSIFYKCFGHVKNESVDGNYAITMPSMSKSCYISHHV